MKKIAKIFACAIFLMPLVLGSCKKKEPIAQPAKPVEISYVVTFKYECANPSAPVTHNTILIYNGALQYNFTNVANGFEFSVNAKSRDLVSINCNNFSTPGYCSVNPSIWLNGTIWKADYGNNSNASNGQAEAAIMGELP